MTKPNSSSAVLSAVLALLALAAATSAQKGKRTDTPVTSTLIDAGDPTLGTNLRIQSDGLGPYSTFSGVKDAVGSVIQTSNTCCQDWELDLGDSRTRSLLLDLREPVAPNDGTGRPFEWDYVHGRIIVKCHTVFPAGFPGMAVGQVLDCPMSVSFPIPGSTSTYWRMAFNPAGDVQTDSVRVECLGADSAGRCNDWTVTPAGEHGGASKNVGRLEKVYFKGNTPPASFGYYYATFSFRVTNP